MVHPAVELLPESAERVCCGRICSELLTGALDLPSLKEETTGNRRYFECKIDKDICTQLYHLTLLALRCLCVHKVSGNAYQDEAWDKSGGKKQVTSSNLQTYKPLGEKWTRCRYVEDCKHSITVADYGYAFLVVNRETATGIFFLRLLRALNCRKAEKYRIYIYTF